MNLRFERQAAELNLRFDRQAADQITFANAIYERPDRQYQQMLVQTRWNVGLIGLFGTIFAVLYGIGQLKP
jgi:hypothetical protein